MSSKSRRLSSHPEGTVISEGGTTGAPTTHRDWLAPVHF